MGFFDFWTESIAIDLGTANTLIIHNDKVVVDSPSIVAIDKRTDKIIAVGTEASLMQGKTHENIKTVRPLKDGVIADFNASEQMISLLIKSIPALKKSFFTPSLKLITRVASPKINGSGIGNILVLKSLLNFWATSRASSICCF